jgi:hypothetical protein
MWQRSKEQTECGAGIALWPLYGGGLPLFEAFVVLQSDIVSRLLFAPSLVES